MTKPVFGKKADLVRYGILPVLLVIENQRKEALDLQNIEVQLETSDGRHVIALDPRRCRLLPTVSSVRRAEVATLTQQKESAGCAGDRSMGVFRQDAARRSKGKRVFLFSCADGTRDEDVHQRHGRTSFRQTGPLFRDPVLTGGVQCKAQDWDVIEDAVCDLSFRRAAYVNDLCVGSHQQHFVVVSLKPGVFSSHQVRDNHVAFFSLQFPASFFHQVFSLRGKADQQAVPFFSPTSARMSGVGSKSNENLAAVFLSFCGDTALT